MLVEGDRSAGTREIRAGSGRKAGEEGDARVVRGRDSGEGFRGVTKMTTKEY